MFFTVRSVKRLGLMNTVGDRALYKHTLLLSLLYYIIIIIIIIIIIAEINCPSLHMWRQWSLCRLSKSTPWAGLHDNVPGRPSTKVPNWWPWHWKLKLSLSQKVGCVAEVVTQSGTSVHLGWVAQDWRTLCHLGSKSAGTLSCTPAQASLCVRKHGFFAAKIFFS